MSCPLCATLRAERDEAVERARQLHAFGGDLIQRLVMELGATTSQARVLALLVQRTTATRDALLDALYFDDPGGGAQPRTVDTTICHVRKKLRPLGIEIETVWGQGWALSSDMKARVRELIGVAP